MNKQDSMTLVELKASKYTSPYNDVPGVYVVDNSIIAMIENEIARGFVDGGSPGHVKVIVNKDFKNPRWVSFPNDAKVIIEHLSTVTVNSDDGKDISQGEESESTDDIVGD